VALILADSHRLINGTWNCLFDQMNIQFIAIAGALSQNEKMVLGKT